jgi:hypothetical protein
MPRRKKQKLIYRILYPMVYSLCRLTLKCLLHLLWIGKNGTEDKILKQGFNRLKKQLASGQVNVYRSRAGTRTYKSGVMRGISRRRNLRPQSRD